MDQTGYLVLSICLLAALVIVFFVTYVIYRRTPPPKGCEDIKVSEEKCASCSNQECQFYKNREEKK